MIIYRKICVSSCMYTIFRISCEFQFLRAVHDFQPDEVFCLTGRKIAKCNMGSRFEFRCSYILTNMSLREFLKNMHVEHLKTEMDYSLKRFPWTPVTESELNYCIADVLGLYEALYKKFKMDRNNLQDVPMTSTGYVRTDFRRAMRKGGFLSMVHDCSPNYDVYLMIRRAFRGGDTHASRFYTGVIMDNVTSYDRASSYPDVLVNYPYPVTSWEKQNVRKLEQLEDGFPYLIAAQFTNIRMRDPFDGHPYLAVHKCHNLEEHVDDNGRVVEAKSLFTYFTDIDLKIIRDQYEWDSAVITNCYRSQYGMLPDAMREVTMDYYRKKTELKGVVGQEVYYSKAKALLNSIIRTHLRNVCDIVKSCKNFPALQWC